MNVETTNKRRDKNYARTTKKKKEAVEREARGKR